MVYFAQLWDYMQQSPVYTDMISPDHEQLLDDLVVGQNFEIALDLLRQQAQPYLGLFPTDMMELARPQKCIKVRDTTHTCPIPPTLEDIRRPPVLSAFPPSHPHDFFRQPHQDYLDPPCTEHDLQEQQNLERIQEMEAQDQAYWESLRADQAKVTTTINEEIRVPIEEPEEEIRIPVEDNPVEDSPIEETKTLPDEPNDGILVVARLPSGEMQRRRFLPTDTFALVIHWTSQWVSDPSVATNFPRQVWDPHQVLTEAPVERERLLLFVS